MRILKKNRIKLSIAALLPYFLCLIFFVGYGVLSVVRHSHFNSGYDLSINDQLVWRYSTFQTPLTTTAPYPDKVKLYEHVELFYAILSPFYWIWSDPIILLLLQVAFLCSGGLAVFVLARKKGLSYSISLAIFVSYLLFYGIQFAVWNDVHSAGFGTAFIAWFIYFLDQRHKWRTLLFFLLAITAKENIAFITFLISFVYFIKRRDKSTILLMLSSILYLFFIFFIYFPHILHFEYPYQNQKGLLSNLHIQYMFNTTEKLQVEFYTLFSFGFLSLLNPLTLLPVFFDLTTYFVIGSDLPGAQGLFGHYRVTLAPLMAWSTIMTIAKYKFLNMKYIAIYLLFCSILVQYLLHLPLSYLSKSWFWHEPSSIQNIKTIEENYLPKTASVVAQVNILSHITHRNKVYTLYPVKKYFLLSHSPCGKNECNWFRWYGDPEYLLVDTSLDWDIRHLLANREDFIDGVTNLEKSNVITVYKRIDTTTLYKVKLNPSSYWINSMIDYFE